MNTIADLCCGPYVCPFPPARHHQPGDRWTCPRCRTQYKLTRPVRERFWRLWAAPHGHWRLTLKSAWRWR